jgi:aspartyl-tRNA(Asn)/glutamyl-tRNA(Gln) amidotransferase subunit B
MPLMEIVTEPDARSPQEALAYLMKLRQILRYLGVSDADMEEGNFRCEPNLSLRAAGSTAYGSKVELKNLNSFRAALHAMEFEVERQTKILESGGRVASETRGWRDETNETFSQRSKEQAHDYRYFPEPDIPPFAVSRERVEEIRKRLPELPAERQQRFAAQFGLSEYESNLLTEARAKADYYEAAVQATGPSLAKPVANWLLGDLSRLLNNAGQEINETKVAPAQLAALVELVENGKISGTAGKQVIEAMFESGRDAADIVAERGLGTIEDEGVVGAAVNKVLSENAKAVADYQAGKTEVIKFLTGKVMQETRGRANAAQVQTILQTELARSAG